MLRIILSITLMLLLTACIENSLIINDIKKTQELTTQTISRIAIPVREHGYNNFKTKIIKSQEDLDTFIEKIKLQKNWNKKENFIESLLLKKIDFSHYNLLLYRISIPSGSTVLLVDAPTGDRENITVTLGSEKEEIGRADMAYYTLAYKVAKFVKTISFDNGIEKTVIKN